MQPFNPVLQPALTPALTHQQSADQRVGTNAGRISPVVLSGTVRFVELMALSGLGMTTAALVSGQLVSGHLAAVPPLHAVASLTTAIVAGALFERLGFYAIPALQRPSRSLLLAVGCWSLMIALLAAVLGQLDANHALGRDWLACWLMSGVAFLTIGRLALAAATRRWAQQGRLTRRAVIYGSGIECQTLLKTLAADTTNDIRVCGIYDDRNTNRGADQTGYPSHGGLDKLVGFARSSHVDLVMLALPIAAETRVIELLAKLWVLPVDIRLAASASRLRLASSAYDYAGDVALIALADKPISDWGMVAKSLFDRIIGGLALIMLAPVMLATALAIKLDSRGPVLFRQKRYGFNNELIEVYKFRSMYTQQADQTAARLVTKDDPRVTRVGRFIRKASIDELPQLFNVLIGNLSLVGPRPHAVSAKAGDKLYHDAFAGYFARHKVKPGITGWAQINGWRGETDTEDKLRHRVEHDLYYIEHWSVLFDVWILLETPHSLLKTDNAY